jgi:hypothetical protein
MCVLPLEATPFATNYSPTVYSGDVFNLGAVAEAESYSMEVGEMEVDSSVTASVAAAVATMHHHPRVQVSRTKWFEFVRVGEYGFKVKVDTGSEVNILPLSFYLSSPLRQVPLQSGTMRLVSYNKTSNYSMGRIEIPVRFRHQVLRVMFEIVDLPTMPIYGFPACEAFGLVTPPIQASVTGEVQHVSVDASSPSANREKLFAYNELKFNWIRWSVIK